MLNEYPFKEEAKELWEGFRYGFKILYTGPRLPIESKNLKSVKGHEDLVREKIKKELDLGRIAGPFKNPPMSTFRVSPIGLVPKKGINEYRLIHHVSYPDKRFSQ